MRIGHTLNVLAQYSEKFIKLVKEKGVRGFIEFIRETIMASVLNPIKISERLSGNIQLRLV